MNYEKNKQKIIVVLGPTASGKSALAVQLAKKFNGEVISADSRQVYKGLDIGTGKISTKEMGGVRHHLLDIASPQRQYSAARYVRDTRRAISEITRRGKFPIVCGGTGLYIDALIGKVTFSNIPPNPNLRKELSDKTAAELFNILKKLDPKRTKTIDPHNPRRLIRAIEIAHAYSRSIRSSGTWENLMLPKLQTLKIGLRLPVDQLRKKIKARLLARLKKGMVAEVKRLHQKGLTWKRMDSLGLEYRYLSRYLQSKISKQEMIAKLQAEIWHYAKRQMTWFKRDKEIRWFPANATEEIKKAVTKFYHRK